MVAHAEHKSCCYPEIVGMAILILGKAFSGFDDFGCFGAFSVGVGEAARGRFDDCPTGAIAFPRSLAGSWMSLDRLSV